MMKTMTSKKAWPQGARVQTHIDRRRARRPNGRRELQLVRRLERMVLMVDGDDPMDVDGDAFERSW